MTDEEKIVLTEELIQSLTARKKRDVVQLREAIEARVSLQDKIAELESRVKGLNQTVVALSADLGWRSIRIPDMGTVSVSDRIRKTLNQKQLVQELLKLGLTAKQITRAMDKASTVSVSENVLSFRAATPVERTDE